MLSWVGVWGAFIRFTLVSRAFGPGAEAGLGLCVEADGFPGPQTHGSWPFEVERKALRLGPRVLNRSQPSRATR